MNPVILIGYSGAWVRAVANVMPERSLIFIDDPEIVRNRQIRNLAAQQPLVREVIEWEYQLDGTADTFYNLHRDLQPAGVVPIPDYSVPFAARLAERYGVPGAGYGAAQLLRNKDMLRMVTAEAGIPNPRSVPVHGPDDVRAFMTEQGGPVVLKPANRRAAVGTRTLYEPAEAEMAWADCMIQEEGAFAPGRPPPLRMLVERFLDGPEFSVEMMVHNGQPVFGAATSKFLFDGPRPVEQGHLHPADVAPELNALLVAETARVVDAVGMDSGFVHCEWIVEDGVPHLVECAGRLPGDWIMDIIVLAWEYDIFGQYWAMMTGNPLTKEQPASATHHAAVWMSAGSEGTVEMVDGVEEARAIPGVHSVFAPSVGDPTQELRSSWDRLTAVIAEGATAADALKAAQQAVERVKVTIGPAAP